MMSKKKFNANLIAAVAGAVAVLGVTTAAVMSNTVEFAKAADPTYTLTLDSSNTPAGLSADSYSNLTGVSLATSLGNAVTFEYKYAKSTTSGHVILGKSSILNPDGTNYYVGNTSPFSGVTSVNVTFSGVDYLYVFASNDGTTYERIQDLTASGSVTFGAGYQYFRFVNGAQSKTDCLITSLVFSYSCNHENTTEAVDRSNLIGSITSGTTYAYDSTVHRDGGTKSFGITTPVAYNQNVYFKLADNALAYSDYSNYHIVFYARFSSDVAITGGKTYDTIKMVLYSDLNNKFSNTEYVPHLDTTYTSSWCKFDISISTQFPSNNSKTSFQYFRIGSNYTLTAGTIYFDDLHLVCGDMRAETVPANETNDLSNSIAIYSNWTSNFTLSTTEDDVSDTTLSSYSKKITCDDSGTKYPFFDTARLGQDDNAGKTLTFDIKNISNWTGAVQIKFHDGTNVYTARGADISTGASGVTGMTYTALSNGWVRVSLVFDTAAAALTGTTYSDGSMPWSGFQFLVSSHASVGILLIDNMTLA
jgi:hypothetical protein